ncbi:hypothetical protein EU527_14130 [Candidatus Thorarchaeota archaeon]|nr:MAG: hypothetical protein EU527_14130 [Candidatus Thorarchaeota archaeon]
MTSIDDNESDRKSAHDSEAPFDIEAEIKKKRRSHRRKSTAKGYVTGTSFFVWIAFTILWLFFRASEHSVFENIAIVFIALLILGALNVVLWIPSVEGKKPKASAVSGIAWIGFLIVWILIFARWFGFYENIGIAIASLLVLGLMNMLLWMPGHGDSGGARISSSAGLIWMIFFVLWLPFANNFSQTIYPINFYQSVAIILASLLLMLIAVVSPWRNKMQISIDGKVSVGGRPKATIGIFFLWILVLVIWMWFIATDYTGYQNVAAVLISFALFFGIIAGMWYTWARTRDEGQESWFSIGLVFAWVLILALWFWFFADDFDIYQNIAIFIVSLISMAAIGGLTQWMKIRDFESMDWED